MKTPVVSPAAQQQQKIEQQAAQIERLKQSLATAEEALQASENARQTLIDEVVARDGVIEDSHMRENAQDVVIKKLRNHEQELLQNQSRLLRQHRDDTHLVAPLWIKLARLGQVLEMVKHFEPFKECSCQPTSENHYAHWMKDLCGFHQIEHALNADVTPRIANDPFVQMFGKITDHFFGGGFVDLDGDSFQTWGMELGLLKQEPYDPEKHGDEIEAERGDTIYVLSDLSKEALDINVQNPTPDNRN